jgi:hypothetical protein
MEPVSLFGNLPPPLCFSGQSSEMQDRLCGDDADMLVLVGGY